MTTTSDLYRRAIRWIAAEPGIEDDIEDLATFSTVALVAELWGSTPEDVSRDVVQAMRRAAAQPTHAIDCDLDEDCTCHLSRSPATKEPAMPTTRATDIDLTYAPYTVGDIPKRRDADDEIAAVRKALRAAPDCLRALGMDAPAIVAEAMRLVACGWAAWCAMDGCPAAPGPFRVGWLLAADENEYGGGCSPQPSEAVGAARELAGLSAR